MAASDSHHDADDRDGRMMPTLVRVAVALVILVALVPALILLAARGPALLLDLAAMGAMFLCL